MFTQKIADRSVEVYADFFTPYCQDIGVLLDLGCGDGSITVGLADGCERVVAIDLEDGFEEAREFLKSRGRQNIDFKVGSAYQLPLSENSVDACFCHSTLEALKQPEVALAEIYRVLKPGALIGVASVEYQGLILHGGDGALLQKFYELRKSLWQKEHVGDPYLGRKLRGMLDVAGFTDIEATTKSICHGTVDAVRTFGKARNRECAQPFYRGKGIEHGLTNQIELDQMAAAWIQWSEARDAYCSFSFCRAVGSKPT